jgi:16S rRNA (cytosine1402-N4)-methyltransferase
VTTDPSNPAPHRRRPRYAGKYPRRFEEKYKELNPDKYPETVARVVASGKTPAGTHLPIMVHEILELLNPQPNLTVVDCTLGYGGHAQAILARIQPEGRLIGLDVDPIELPRTERRLRSLGFGSNALLARQANFAGLPRILAAEGLSGADCILADLGLSSMQIDTPERGFSVKLAGPLDMRMNPGKGQPASSLLSRITPDELLELFRDNSDEPFAESLAERLAGKNFVLTTELAGAVHATLSHLSEDERNKSVRRVFQALRIAVNEEFGALETLLRHLPVCLNSGGRVAILTFHSGEDRRVKKAFQAAFRAGLYSRIAQEVVRPSFEECRANPRATSAKLRWAKLGFR